LKKPYKYISPISLAESVERQILHIGGFTLLLLKFDMASIHYTLLIKECRYSTFRDFVESTLGACFEVRKKTKDEAIELGLKFLEQRNSQLHRTLSEDCEQTE
jgi:hypothetical protein